MCLSDVCHFVEHGTILQELTVSPLVNKSMQLVQNCQSFSDILNVRIFKQVSIFLRELSNDNEYIKALPLDEISVLVEGTAEAGAALQVTEENVDFYWNLVELHFNVISQKEGSIGVFTRLPFYVGKLREVLGAQAAERDPVTYFRANFLAKY